jgi:hypothetical protein
MLRISARTVLSRQDPLEKARFSDPDRTYRKRSDVLDEIRSSAVDFISDIFSEYDLPSTPNFIVNTIKGFYDATRIDYQNQRGIVIVTGSIRTSTGHMVDLEIPIPFSRGSFLKPSVMVIEGKRAVLSNDRLAAIIGKYEVVEPHAGTPFSADGPTIQRTTIENKDIFSAPQDTTGLLAQTKDDYF